MMKKVFTLVTALIMGIMVLGTTETRASHAVGADITYQYVGPNQFLLTLRLYRDCFGIPAPTSATIAYASSCFPGGNITLQPLPGTGLQIPTSPCVPTVVTTCNGGSGYGIQEWIYQGVVTLPGPCVDWRFEYNLCCRNDQINTLINPASFNLYVSTTLDNFNFPTNSSPTFSNIPVTQFCIGNQFYYSQGATDIDGDSLVFSLAPSETNLNQPVTYAPGYGPLTPLASSTPIVCNPNNGTISFTPSVLQVGVLAVVCEEFRNGVKIGQVKRDMQMKVVSTCIGTAPFILSPTDPNGNPAPYYTASCGDTSIYIVLDQPVQCGSIVQTDIRILTPQGLPNPVLSATPVNCINGQTDSILVTFFYPLTVGTTYAYTKEGFDGNTFLSECGVEVPEFDSLAFNVTDPGVFNTEPVTVTCAFDSITVSFDYDVVCNTLSGNGSEFLLVDANGVSYPVTGTSGCTQASGGYNNIITFLFGQTVAPASPAYLIVQNGSDANTFTNRCNTFILPGDTLAILSVTNNISIDLGAPQTTCDNGPFPTLDAGLSGATYTWSLNGTTIAGATSQTISANQTGNYSCLVTYSAACSTTDNVDVTIVATPIVALGSDIQLCATEPFPVLDAGNPGATFQWFESGNAVAGATSQTYQPTAAGSYSVSVTNGGICTASDDINIVVIPNLPVALPTDQTICSNDQLPVLDAGFPGSTYSWSLNGSAIGGNSQTISTTTPGNYSVIVTAPSGCTGTDDYNLAVVQSPVVALGNDIQLCATDPIPVLDAGNPGAVYQWFESGNAILGATSQTYQPTTAGNYSVSVTNGGICSGTDDLVLTILANLIVSLPTDQSICSSDPLPSLDAGNPGSTYVWSLNGSTIGGNTQTISTTAPGIYSVFVTSASGCTGTDEYTLTVIQTPSVSLGNDIQLCATDPIPVLDAGNPGATYQWFESGNQIAGATSQTYQPIAAGTYSVAVTNGGICTGTDEIIVIVNANLTVTLPSDQTICSNDPSPVLDAGNSGSTYVWSLNGTVIGGSTQTISTSGSGNYSVIVTSSTGCTGTDNYNLSIVQVPVVALGNDINLCANEPFPVLDAGNNGATYQWFLSGSAIAGATSQTYQPNSAGTYSVSVTNGGLCSGTDEINVVVNPILQVSLANDQTICSYDTYPVLDAGIPSATYAWSLNGSSIGGNTQTLNTNASGTYSVLVTSSFGCTGTDDYVLVVVPQLTFDLGAEIITCFDNQNNIIISAPDSSTNTYAWTLNTNPAFTASTSSISPTEYGTYNLLITDGNGCIGRDSIDVTEMCEIKIPNIFTPGNNDGLNDLFIIENVESNPNTKVVIVNRWGNEVYSTNNYDNLNNVWDGGDLPDGTYFYVVVTSSGKEYNGAVKLLRADKN